MNDEILAATIDLCDTLDVYLMANWDEHARKRVRTKVQHLYTLLVREQKARKREASK